MVEIRVRALCLLATVAAVAGPPARMAPYAAWRTVATAHYRIHYPPALASWAEEVAGRIEWIHEQVTARVGYQSPGPIQVVLGDPAGEPNGLAVPLIPAPFVVLWRTEPRSDSLLGTFPDSWTEVLMAHELTHIHHLTRPSRPWDRHGHTTSLFRLPLGPLAWKAPRWVSEGYATLLEGRITGSGRPNSVQRAAVLRQWARAGKLPTYGNLDGSEGFLGSSMAYLAGSAYLEWLERQRPDQPDILQRLWKQLASSRHRLFPAAFAATFGFSAQDGYQRFQAELSHDALEWEARLKAQGLREGELWTRVRGAVSSLGVSPDGGRLVACLETSRDPGLRVWDLAAPAARGTRPDPALADPFNGVADAPPEFTPPVTVARLPTLDHRLPREPRWVDDRTIQFQLKRPDREGILHPATAVWRPGIGVETHPGPLPESPGPVLAPIHRQGRWVLEWEGQALPLAGQAAGPGWVDARRQVVYAACDLEGIWNLVQVPFRREAGVLRFDPPRRLTRTPAAAWNPAPTPDGRWLYYTSLDARGTEIRRLDLALPPLGEAPAPEPRILAPRAVMPPPPQAEALPAPTPAPPSAPYRARDNLRNRAAAGLSVTPSGSSFLVGAAGSDLLGRASWQVLAGLGDSAGPRGAALGASSSAWPWKPSAMVFSALERPSRQRFVPVPADQERRGGELTLAYDDLGATRYWVSPSAAWERVQLLDPDGSAGPLRRSVLGLRSGLDWLWARGAWGLDLAPGLEGYLGRTDAPGASRSWQALRASLRVRLETPLLPITFLGQQGRAQGDAREGFSLGGVTTPLVPVSLDWGRVEQPALPAGLAAGNRFQRWRWEAGGALRAYGEGAALVDAGGGRGPFQRVVGLEWAQGRPTRASSDQVHRRLRVEVGLHRPLDGPMKNRTVGTVTVLVRP